MKFCWQNGVLSHGSEWNFSKNYHPYLDVTLSLSDLQVAVNEVDISLPFLFNMKGTVKWYDPSRKYGFIKVTDTYLYSDRIKNNEVFVHETGLSTQNIKAGEIVQFDLASCKKRTEAVNVQHYSE